MFLFNNQAQPSFSSCTLRILSSNKSEFDLFLLSNLLQNQDLLCAGLQSYTSLKQHPRDLFRANENTISYTDGINQEIEACTVRPAISETSRSMTSQTPETAAISEISHAAATRLWGTLETEKFKMNLDYVPISVQRIAKVMI